MPYETFDHTADIGLRIAGRDLEELFRASAQGLYHLITDWDKMKSEGGSRHAAPLQTRSFTLNADHMEDLFFTWLRELLFIFSSEKLIFQDFDFETLTEKGLRVKASGCVFDPKRFESRYEVKAVTHYEFKVEKTGSAWIAEVILDI